MVTGMLGALSQYCGGIDQQGLLFPELDDGDKLLLGPEGHVSQWLEVP